MEVRTLHRWDLTPAEARTLQRQLAAQIDLTDPPAFAPRRVAGIDVGFEDGGRVTRAAVVVLDVTTLEPLDAVIARRPTCFPYVPGLLSFRECPALIDALCQLQATPDLLMCDGQGIAHPRRLGIASHIGLVANLPTIGVAKSRLIGHFSEPPNRRGAHTPLLAQPEPARRMQTTAEEIVGAVVRTRIGVKPLFVSPGHKLSVATAVALTMQLAGRYRLPEPTRWADGLASRRPACLRRLPVALLQSLGYATAP